MEGHMVEEQMMRDTWLRKGTHDGGASVRGHMVKGHMAEWDIVEVLMLER